MFERALTLIQSAWCRYLRFSAAPRGFLFIPLIIMGGRLVFRVIMNTWNMLED